MGFKFTEQEEQELKMIMGEENSTIYIEWANENAEDIIKKWSESRGYKLNDELDEEAKMEVAYTLSMEFVNWLLGENEISIEEVKQLMEGRVH